MSTDVKTVRLRAHALSVGYEGEAVVPDINLEVAAGEAVALIGTNGSGKSTLLKTIVGLIPALDGRLEVLGGAAGSSPRRVAYLGQFHSSGYILPIRAADVVRMGRFPLRGLRGRMTGEDDEAVHEAMKMMGIEGLADAPLRSLSGGQQQRVYLAQVLAHRADLLALDEPAAGLDAGGRELYLRAVQGEVKRGASVIVATHDIQEEAAQCHQVLLLARRVVAIGPPAAVLTPGALLATFGVVVTGDRRLHVIEARHGHDGGPR
jgi:ABC-type Mn2+/Zn2+ transport system ATPase subunit